MIQEDDVLPRASPSRHFCQHFMRRTTQQTLLAINLASQEKTTKLYFSSQVRKQFKLLAFHLSHYAVVCEMINLWIAMFENSALFLTLRLIWSVNQIVLFNGFLSDFVEITSCVYTKTIILFNLGEQWLWEYLHRRFRGSVNI